MSRFWSDQVAGLTPYVPGEQPKVNNLLKLNTNEHPYGPSPRAIDAIREQAGDALRLYPDPNSTALREAIAQAHGVGLDQVFVGNGSDEVLAHVFHGLFLRQGRPLVMPDITYSFYPTYCKLYGVPQQVIPLAKDFSLRIEDYTAAFDTAPAGIIFANPNAPTGIALSLTEIASIASAHRDSVIVVDEAYVDFGAESAVALLPEFDNILVVQTFSKSRSLAGLRVGFALGSSELIQGLVRVKDSFNSYPLDRLAQAGALASFLDTEYFEETRRAVMQARDTLQGQLESLEFEVLPSKANFIFACHPRHEGAALMQALRERQILVRHFTAPRIQQFLRITVGTQDDCHRLYTELSRIVADTP